MAIPQGGLLSAILRILALAGVVAVAACDDLLPPILIVPRYAGNIYDLVTVGGNTLPDSGVIRIPPGDTLVEGHIHAGVVVFGELLVTWETTYKAVSDTAPRYRQIQGGYQQIGDTAVFLFGRWAVRKGDTLTLRPEANVDISGWLSGKTWKLVRRLP
jgi:hypothetical protein